MQNANIPGRPARRPGLLAVLTIGAYLLIGVFFLAVMPASRDASAPVPAATPVPDFSLTVSPARMIVTPGTDTAAWRITNHGTMPQTVVVTTSQEWAQVNPQTFSLAAGESRAVLVTIGPSRPSTGRAYVSFTVPASGGPGVSLSRGLSAVLSLQPVTAAPAARVFNWLAVLGVLLAVVGVVLLTIEVMRRRRRLRWGRFAMDAGEFEVD